MNLFKSQPFLILLVFTVSRLVAADVSIRTMVDKNPVGLNDRFVYTIEVSGESTSLPRPVYPSFEGFSVLSGPNTSTNIQYVNGAMTSSNSYSFYLMPQKEGTFMIPSVSIDEGGETISSNSVEIKVVKGSAPANAGKSALQNKEDADIKGDNLYLKTEVDKKSVYQNEQIIVAYKLYFRVSVRSYNPEKIPANPGFWTEEFQLGSQPTVNTEIINGVNYQVATLRQVALFPTRSGQLTVEPMVISVDAVVKRQRRSRSLFDDFFDDPFGRTVKKSITSQAVTINVKPLPLANKPSDFEGTVGNYRMDISADKTELKANEAVSLRLNINGQGNMKLLNAPKVNLPSDMEVYEPKEKTNVTRENNRIGGSKEIEYVIVPRFAGEYRIDPVTFSFFDPQKRTYQRATTRGITLNILPGDKTDASLLAGSSLSKQEITLLGKDIRYIKETFEYYPSGRKLYTNWLYLLSYLIPLIALLLAWRYQVYQNKLRGNVRLARQRKAGRVAAKHLAVARKMLKSNHKEDFYRATTDALQGFVCDKLDMQLSDFNLVEVSKLLEKSRMSQEDIAEYVTCLQESDFQRYAGSGMDTVEMKSFYTRVSNIMTGMEKSI
ncbi:MAG: protein BatD [Calditrichales bacterium]|nr:MAG: protein BatD [Calditrichales bacterium]